MTVHLPPSMPKLAEALSSGAARLARTNCNINAGFCLSYLNLNAEMMWNFP